MKCNRERPAHSVGREPDRQCEISTDSPSTGFVCQAQSRGLHGEGVNVVQRTELPEIEATRNAEGTRRRARVRQWTTTERRKE